MGSLLRAGKVKNHKEMAGILAQFNSMTVVNISQVGYCVKIDVCRHLLILDYPLQAVRCDKYIFVRGQISDNETG